MCHKYRSSHPEVFCKTDTLKSFVKFTRKHLCWSLVLKGQRAAGCLKRVPDTGVLPVGFAKFLRTHILENFGRRKDNRDKNITAKIFVVIFVFVHTNLVSQ